MGGGEREKTGFEEQETHLCIQADIQKYKYAGYPSAMLSLSTHTHTHTPASTPVRLRSLGRRPTV